MQHAGSNEVDSPLTAAATMTRGCFSRDHWHPRVNGLGGPGMKVVRNERGCGVKAHARLPNRLGARARHGNA